MFLFLFFLLFDVELFKDFFVVGGYGLVCVDVGKGSTEELILY